MIMSLLKQIVDSGAPRVASDELRHGALSGAVLRSGCELSPAPAQTLDTPVMTGWHSYRAGGRGWNDFSGSHFTV